MAQAAGLRGKDARDFIKRFDLSKWEITAEQQLDLFNLCYAQEEREVLRIINKADVIRLYGRTDWTNLHPKIKQVVIDLKFRGDYTGTIRTHIQTSIARNNLKTFTKLLSDKRLWPSVPQDRFNRRVAFLNEA